MAEAAIQLVSEDYLLQSLRDWVRTHFGINFAGEQFDRFRSRIEGLCRDARLDVATLYGRVMSGDRPLVQKLAEVVSTNHTFFNREPELFQLFTSTILPEFSRQGDVRVWSAAASSGDEAYTLSMCAHEKLGPAATRVRILGTDISERQVKTAEQGVYPMHQLSQLGERLKTHFVPAGLGHYQLKPEYRKLCTFRRMNLTQMPWPFEQKFHVIFLRNVLYYFEPSMRRKIVEGCYDAAEPGAWLITSFTEPMIDLVTRWRADRPAVFRKDA